MLKVFGAPIGADDAKVVVDYVDTNHPKSQRCNSSR